jgi:CRP/FNR family transcriptional regulator/CRP/FNR family cyclic AMP-dependent transcriptional regulator
MSSSFQPFAGPGFALDRAWVRPTAKDWAPVLASLPLFSRLGKRQLRKIAGLAQFVEFTEGDVVVQAGEPGDAFYVILSGRAKVLGKPRARALRTGSYFGEMALIDGEPRSATIMASTELQAMKLPRRPFMKLLEQDPKIAVAMLADLSARVRRLEKQPAE